MATEPKSDLLPIDVARYSAGGPRCHDVSVGLALAGGEQVRVRDDPGHDERNVTMYVRGVPGSGKSYLLAGLIMQDLARGAALGLIDPTGSVYRMVLPIAASVSRIWDRVAQSGDPTFRARAERERAAFLRRFVLLDFDSPDHGCTFNPLCLAPGEDPERAAGDLIKAIERLFQRPLTETPRLHSLLHAATQLVALAGGTVLHLPELLMLPKGELRSFIARLESQARADGRHLPESVRQYMEFFLSFDRRDQIERVESTINALNFWLNDPQIRKFLDAARGNLDFDRILNGNLVFLAHLPAGRNTSLCKSLGNLLVSTFHRHALRRVPEERARPFYLYLDEFHLYCADEEFAVGTATLRQYGLRCVLAHQAADQPPLDKQPGVLNAIMASSGLKIFFRLGMADAEEVAREVLLPSGLMEKRRYEQITMSHQEAVSHARQRSTSEAFAEQTGESFTLTDGEAVTDSVQLSETRGETRITSKATGITVTKGENRAIAHSKTHGMTLTMTEGLMTAEATGEASGSTTSEGHTDSAGRSEAAGTSNQTSVSAPQEIMADPLDARLTVGQGMTAAAGTQRGSADTFSRAVSKVISASRSLARSRTSGSGVTDSASSTESAGRSESTAHTKTLTEGLSELFNLSRGLSQAIGRTRSRARGETRSRTWSHSVTMAETDTVSKSATVSRHEVSELFTLEEESRLNAQKLYTLPQRHAYLVRPPSGGKFEAVAFSTHTVPSDAFPTRAGGRDYLSELAETARPPAEPPPPPLLDLPGSLGRQTGDGEPEGFA